MMAKHEKDTSGKYQSGLEGKTNTPERSGKNVQFNSGSGGAKGERYDPKDKSPDPNTGRDLPGQLSSRNNQGFGRGEAGQEEEDKEGRR